MAVDIAIIKPRIDRLNLSIEGGMRNLPQGVSKYVEGYSHLQYT